MKNKTKEQQYYWDNKERILAKRKAKRMPIIKLKRQIKQQHETMKPELLIEFVKKKYHI